MTTSKYDDLRDRLRTLDSALVCYSGGVDSTLLAVAAHAVLGDRCLAVLARSDTYPQSEATYARTLASDLGFRLLEVNTHELTDPRFRANTSARCYYCKRELYGLLIQIARTRGLAVVVDGNNADDLGLRRPGWLAAEEHGVASPLADVGMTKSDIREVSRQLGLPNWDKPSTPCLATRIPYGTEIDEDTLGRIEHAEDALHALGLRQIRVRAHGEVARIEVEPEEMEAAWALREELVSAVRGAGFSYVAQDLEGYRTGSLDETLPDEPAT